MPAPSLRYELLAAVELSMNQHGTGCDVMPRPLAGLEGGPYEGQDADEEYGQDDLTDHNDEAQDCHPSVDRHAISLPEQPQAANPLPRGLTS